MNSLIMCLLSCTFSEVQKLIKTNGANISISARDQGRLNKLRELLNMLHNAGHLG